MKALVYGGRKDIKVADVVDPKIEKADDIIIKVTSTSICGSDLHIYHGMVPGMQKGLIMGHETMGIVEEVGPKVTKVKKGDRVIVPFPIACGHCWYCENELWSQCDNSNPNGLMGGVFGCGDLYGGYNGGQAEYLRVPYANVGPTVVPEELTDEQALFLTDMLPTAYWGVDIGGVKRDDIVVILGCGPIGLTAVKFAALAGAKRIIAVDTVKYRLEHASKHYGVETVHLMEHEDTGEYIYEITNGGADVVIDCVGVDGKLTKLEKIETLLKLQGGSKSAIEIATQSVRKGGTVVLVGIYGTRYNMFPLGDFFAKNVTLKMGLCPVHSYVEPILKMIQKGKIDPTDIITHILSMDDGADAYKIFDKKEDNCIKVILKP